MTWPWVIIWLVVLGPFTNSSDIRRDPNARVHLCSSHINLTETQIQNSTPFSDLHRNTYDLKHISGYLHTLNIQGLPGALSTVFFWSFLPALLSAFSFLCFLHPPPLLSHTIPSVEMPPSSSCRAWITVYQIISSKQQCFPINKIGGQTFLLYYTLTMGHLPHSYNLKTHSENPLIKWF